MRYPRDRTQTGARLDGKGLLVLGIAGFAVLLTAIFLFPRGGQSEGSSSRSNPDSSEAEGGFPNRDVAEGRSSKSETVREGTGPRPINSEPPDGITEESRIRNLLDLNEVTPEARRYYDLSDDDVAAILKVTHELREKIIDAIHERIEELEDTRGAARAFVFRADPKLRHGFEHELRERLAKLVNAEFGKNSIAAFQWSPGFLKAGGMDLVFYINPGNPGNSSTVESIRFEIWNSEIGARASHWEGPPERFNRMYQLDFSEVLAKPEAGEDELGSHVTD